MATFDVFHFVLWRVSVLAGGGVRVISSPPASLGWKPSSWNWMVIVGLCCFFLLGRRK